MGQNTNNSNNQSNGTPTVTVPSENERDDIIQVASFIPTNPWLIFDRLSSKVDGFKCTVYLGAPMENNGRRSGIKGVFGNGIIRCQMFLIEEDEKTGKESLKPIHTWELSRDEAYQWRANEATLLGWGYGLRLRWPDELDVAGKKVAFLLSYQRTDGRNISSSRPSIRRVPLRGI